MVRERYYHENSFVNPSPAMIKAILVLAAGSGGRSLLPLQHGYRGPLATASAGGAAETGLGPAGGHDSLHCQL